jgi:outer membrane immunogenic protein
MSGGSIRRVAWRPAGKPKRSSTTRAFAGALVSAAGLGLCPGAATAADLSLPRAPVAPVASAPAAIYSWTGFYIGGQVGAGGSRSSWSDPVTGGNNIFTGGAAFLGGGVFGADYPSNALVLGVEGDFNWTEMNGNGTNSVGDAIGAGTQWTSTVAGRVGAAFDRLLVYGKGGGAFARDRSSFTDRAGNSASNAFARTGWIAGIGLEYGITENWLSKVEYDYLSFGTQLLNFTTATPTAYASSASLSAQQVKAGINLRFSGPR